MGVFTGKVVLILGGSRSTGTTIVHCFVANGANVRFTYAGLKDAAKRLVREAGATVVFTDSADRDVVIDVVHKSDTLDILVVNTDIGVFGEALELNADDIGHLFKIDTHAPYHVPVEAARQMPEGGCILITGSVNGERMPVAGIAAYAASKSVLQGMARGLVRDFEPRGITINVVQPEPINTDANPANEPIYDMLHSLMAIKKYGQSEEVAGMVAWLARPKASFVTGAMHIIDGTFGT